MVHAEGGEVVVVLMPDGASVVGPIEGVVGGILEGNDNREQPGDNREHLEGDDGVLAVLIALGERVDW